MATLALGARGVVGGCRRGVVSSSARRRMTCSTGRGAKMTTTTTAAAAAADDFPSHDANYTTKKTDTNTNVDGSERAAISDKPYEKQVVLIVGKGRVGKALDKMAESLKYFHGFIVRNDIFTPSAQRDGPIYIATHASDIDGALTAIHSNRYDDLVLLQGGLLRRAWLDARNLGEATQVALYASADDAGDIKDGGGSTVVTGPYAKHVVGMLEAGGVACAEVDADAFARVSFEKLLWASMFWLLCCCDDGDAPRTVGDVIDDPAGMERFRKLADEIIDVAVAAGEITFDEEGGGWCREAAVEGLLAYSRAIPSSTPSREMATKEGAFRNGWFLAVGGAEAQPLHVELLTRAGVDVDSLTEAGGREHHQNRGDGSGEEE